MLEHRDGGMETVNHPRHYRSDTGFEAIAVIEAWGLGFCLGNVVKYIARYGHKGSKIETLKKCIWYLQRELNKEEAKLMPKDSFPCFKASL